MPRGRHRHSPPLHRLLPPSAIAGVSLVCAAGPWLFTETVVLRGLAAGAAVTAVLGAVVMRRWDSSAGKQVADLTRARASDEWRYEERVAELETDLDESRELRVKLEHKLRAKRTELAGLRNEHAALLRRYATAETERASALEGRRLLAIETTAPARALPAALTAGSQEPEVPEEPEASEVVSPGSDADTDADTDAVEAVEATVVQKSPEVFSPAGSSLFLRAYAALNRISNIAPEPDGSAPSDPVKPDPVQAGSAEAGAEASASDGAAAEEGEAEGKPEAVGGHERAAAEAKPSQSSSPQDPSQDLSQDPSSKSPQSPDPADPEDPADPSQPSHPADHSHPAKPSAHSAPAEPSNLPAPAAPAKPPKPVKPVKPSPSSGHFTVPTAVAVVPAAPVRRPSVEGGFDFFGTQQEPSATALEAVQNEDLADVVGQEALALHKAEAEAGFKPADEDSRGVGQVIDLTVHDETERIDVAELRSAVS